MKISIIIPNYNGEALLEKNLPGVIQAATYYHVQTKNDVEVIVVDDASTDHSRDVLKKWDQNHRGEIAFYFYNKEKNEGFSPTVNFAVTKASGDVLVLLNTDVTPKKDFLIPLLEHFTDKKVFAVGAMDKSIERGKEVLRGRGVGKWERGFLHHNAGSLDKTTTLWVSGGSSAFRRSIWEHIGGLEDLYAPFYWEDIDVSYRALKMGYITIFDKRSIVTHEHEKGAIKVKYTHNDVEKIAYKNQFIFVWINADSSMLGFHVLWLPYHILKAILRFDKNFFSGFFAALKQLSQIIQKRTLVQKQFIYSDYDIMVHYKK